MIPHKTTNDQVMLRILNAESEELDIAIWSSWPLIQDIAQAFKRDSLKNSVKHTRVRIVISDE